MRRTMWSAACAVWPARRSRPGCCPTSARSAACSSPIWTGWIGRCWWRAPTASGPSSRSPFSPAGTTRSGSIWSTTASTTFSCRAPSPLFFLDYLATGRVAPDVLEAVVRGLAGRLRAERVRVARRGNGGNAGVLRGRRIRYGRLHRRHGRRAAVDRRQRNPSGRSAARPAVVRAAHERVFPRPADRIRDLAPAGHRARGRARRHRRRGAAATAPVLSAPGATAAGLRRTSPSRGSRTSPGGGRGGGGGAG